MKTLNNLIALAVVKKNKYIKTYTSLKMEMSCVSYNHHYSTNLLNHAREKYPSAQIFVVKEYDDGSFDIDCKYDREGIDSITHNELNNLLIKTAKLNNDFKANNEYIDYQHYIEANPWEITVNYSTKAIVTGSDDPVKTLLKISKENKPLKIVLQSNHMVRAVCVNGEILQNNREVPCLRVNEKEYEHFKKKWNSISLN